MDAAAREMKLDPAELRRRNMIRPEQMPYKNAMGQTYDSGAFEKILDQGLALADWNGFAARREESKARGKLRGRGIATFLEWTGGNAFEEKVSVDVTPDGFIEIFSATQAMGQGIATSYAQLAVDVFGVPIEKIRIVQGDTDRGNGFGSAGSRSLFTGGSAVQRRVRADGRRMRKDARRRGARGGGRRHRVPRRPLLGRRHRSSASTCSSSPASSRGSASIVDATGDRRRRRPGRTPATSARSRSIPTAATSQVVAYASVNDIGRVVSPTIVARPGRRRRGAGHRPGALRAGRLRRRQRPARHRQLHGLRDAARRHGRRASAPSSTPRSRA